mmetsp:Transcript_101693/g.286705  ORF Transcript_101693/g.286705 Transcript_101693/m.286705 type:complete len:111 (-) Transcript_101693:135-467(-)
MAPRRSSPLLIIAVCSVVALCALSLAPAFVTTPTSSAPALEKAALLRGGDSASSAAHAAWAFGAVAAMVPEAAHAANQGYAILQLGWAVFIIGLGPAVLFWIYFNKPELL